MKATPSSMGAAPACPVHFGLVPSQHRTEASTTIDGPAEAGHYLSLDSLRRPVFADGNCAVRPASIAPTARCGFLIATIPVYVIGGRRNHRGAGQVHRRQAGGRERGRPS